VLCLRPGRDKFPLFFSQDGTPPHEAARELAQSYDQVGHSQGSPCLLHQET
jgi:hypothetical protein